MRAVLIRELVCLDGRKRSKEQAPTTLSAALLGKASLPEQGGLRAGI
jgi:hypothetical protein